MKRLDTPRLIPDRPPYVLVDLGEMGPHHLRVPSVHHLADAAKAIGVDSWAALLVATGTAGGVTPGAMVEAMRRGGADVLRLIGFVVGTAWYHSTLGLEAERGRDPLDYGGAVLDELNEAGYTLDQVALLGLAVMDVMYRRNQLSAQTQEAISFFGRPPELSEGSSSPSGGISVATSGPGIA